MEINENLEDETEDAFLSYPVKFSDITDDPDTLRYLEAHEESRIYREKIAKLKIEHERWLNRFKVPHDLSKAELNELLKHTQKEIDNWKIKSRNPENNEATKGFVEACLESWIEKKTKIKSQLKFFDKTKDSPLNIQKAKQYPVEQLLEFNSGGFVRCLWHEESTPSLHFDKRRNKAHCFAGCGDFDAIDIYQKLHNVDFSKAVKALT